MDELKEREQLPDLLTCACENLRASTRRVTRLYDHAFKPIGLKASQLPVLRLLHSVGPVNLSGLSDRLLMNPTTLARILKPLERKGLVSVRLGIDRRNREIELTQAGKETLSRAYPYWKSAQETIIEVLGEDGLRTLLTSLSNLKG